MGWLAAAVFVVAAGYGALMPLLPGWLRLLMADGDAATVARHVGYLSGVYTAGVLIGAPLWGVLSDRFGRSRVLLMGLVGYIASLLPMLRADWVGVGGIYALRATTGFFVAAVVPVVPALVAEYTPKALRARRFAWLGAVSLLGTLFGPSLNAGIQGLAPALGALGLTSWSSTDLVIAVSVALGALMMLGLALTLPKGNSPGDDGAPVAASSHDSRRELALWGLNAIVMFVLAGFELGIVLQGQQTPALSEREVSLMFAECSLVMLAINLLLFLTGWLERIDARLLIGAGLLSAIGGLTLLALHRGDGWMYWGVSLAAAGTGLVLPTVSFLAAGSAHRRLGAAMGGLTAAAGLGQTIGSAAGGWLFAAAAQASFVWLAAPLVSALGVMALRSRGGTLPR